MGQDITRNFVRERDGVWRCVEPCELQLPQGRVQITPGSVFTKGTKFMNVELVLLLEEQYERYRQR